MPFYFFNIFFSKALHRITYIFSRIQEQFNRSDISRVMKKKTDQISPQAMQNLARMPFKESPTNAGSKTEVNNDAPIPKKLKKFEVIELIGIGGMGRVYRGRHPDLDIPVAIKTVSKPHLPSSQSIERFKREARLATKLNNPNIVRVYDVDKEGDLYFIVSEFVDGSDLSQLLNSSPGKKLPAKQALDIIIQITRALVETAKHKIVHRDIKPANILITKEGVPKLADLGIAKQDFSEGSQPTTQYTITQEGLTMGTLGYMAPEQILDSRNVDIRADLFSLGATFYHMLTGQPPFGGDNYCKIVGNCLHGDTPNARAVNPDLPALLCETVSKMMFKDRRDRYQSPNELLEVLENIEIIASELHVVEDPVTPIVKSQSSKTPHESRPSKNRLSSCPKCGVDIPREVKFCGQCGYRTQLTCPKCSSKIPDGFKFCGECGFQVDDSCFINPRKLLVNETTNLIGPASPSSMQLDFKGTLSQTPTTRREERRQVAVLIVEVSGITTMLDKLDPEDVHEIMNQIFEGISREVHKEDGYVDNYGEAKIMALFGAPVAHEDDTSRACRAALAMQDFVEKFDEKCWPRTDVHLQLQVAINFGLVFVGGVGSEFHKEYAALGKTVDLALRMESNAPPAGILTSESVVKMVKSEFQFGPIQRIKINNSKSIEARLLLYEFSKLSPWPIDQYFTPFVGRGDEVQHLINLMKHSKRNKRWIEICGEQGVGKTRIVREAAQRTKNVKIFPILVTSNINAQLFGLIKLLVHTILYEITGKKRLPESQADFGNILIKLGKDLETFIDALWYLSAPRSIAVRAPDPDPKILRGIIDQGVALLIQSFAKSNPEAVLFIDGYDMADEISAELIERQGLLPGGWPISVIVTVRAGRQISLPDQVTIQLSPLSNKLALKLFEYLVHDARVPEPLRSDILDRSIGIPFHIEEMVQTLIDSEILIPSCSDDPWSCKSSDSKVSLPPSLFSSMLSRIDRLTESERDLMRQCAVQGLEFNEDVAEAVRHDPKWQGPPVKNLLPNLKSRGLVGKDFITGRGTSSWKFRLPLMRDACYQTLPIRNRRELHARIADVLREIAGGAIETVAESLAHHYEQAQIWRPAAEANLIVGKRARDMFINDKALTFFRKTIELVDKLNSDQENDIHTQVLASVAMIQIFLRIGNYHEAEKIVVKIQKITVRGVDKAEICNLYGLICHSRGLTDRAKALFQKAFTMIGNKAEHEAVKLDILYNLAKIYYREGNLDLAKYYLRQYRMIATQDGGLCLIRADILDGNIAQTESRYTEAVELFSKARQIADQVGSMSDLANAHNNLGNTLRDDGDYDRAKENFNQALAIWSKIGLTESIAGVHLNLGNLAMSQGHFADARKDHKLSLKAFQKIGHVRGIALAQINLAVAAIEEGNGNKAVKLAKGVVRSLENAHYAVLRGQSLVILGEAHLACNNVKKAEEVFNKIIESYEKETHLLAISGALRGLGRVAILTGNFRDATNHLDAAIAYFKKLNREQETTRTEIYRAEAFLRLGNYKEAREILERANNRFIAIGALRDSAHAMRLLQELIEGRSSPMES